MPKTLSYFFSRPLFRMTTLVCMTLWVGCGRNSGELEFVPVKGTVTYQGKPLESGLISFVPDREKGTQGPMANGRINERGEFELQTRQPGDGALVGFHKVAISRYKETAFDPNNPAPALKDISLIPTKYADDKTSQLTAEVTTTPEKNVYLFELQ